MTHASETAPKRLRLSIGAPEETKEWPDGAKELADRVERRRHQNRLNQRAYRELSMPACGVHNLTWYED